MKNIALSVYKIDYTLRCLEYTTGCWWWRHWHMFSNYYIQIQFISNQVSMMGLSRTFFMHTPPLPSNPKLVQNLNDEFEGVQCKRVISCLLFNSTWHTFAFISICSCFHLRLFLLSVWRWALLVREINYVFMNRWRKNKAIWLRLVEKSWTPNHLNSVLGWIS